MYSGDSDDVFAANGEGSRPANAYGWGDASDPGGRAQPHTGDGAGRFGPYGAGAGAPAPGSALGFMDPLATQNWGRSIFPYIKSMDMLVSPGAQNDVDPRFAPTKTAGAGRTSYAMDGCISNLSQTAVSKPADQIAFQVRATTTKEAICLPRQTVFSDAVHANDADLLWAGQSFTNGGNYGFADGHAKFMKHSQVKFKNLGFWEYVNTDGNSRWIGPNDNPTLRSDPTVAGADYWRAWGACDASKVPD